VNKQEYIAFHKECCDRMVDITSRKNADYTGTTDDPFFNFRLCETIGVCSVAAGFVVRMTDKLQRIVSLAVQGNVAKVLDEAVQDTLLDLANYCILFAGYLKSRKGSSNA
jgi:hypothetical protein